MIGGSRSAPTLSVPPRDRQEEPVEPLDELPLEESDFLLDDEPADESDFLVDDESEVEPDDEPLSELDDELSFDESLEPDGVVVDDFLPRLSVLKKPEPLNVTPTGVNTFFTGSTSPVSGWAISVSESSWNPCWTSIVSPESTNL